MRRRRTRVSVLLSVLLLVLVVPTASAGVERTDYSAFQFPMGWPGTVPPLGYPDCPGTYVTTPFPACVIEPGTVTRPGHGRWTIRDMVLLHGVLPTSDPSLAGYQVSTLNANLDASGNGPAWGTFTTYTGSRTSRSSAVPTTASSRTPGWAVTSSGRASAPTRACTSRVTFSLADIPNVGNVIGEIKQTGP